MQTPMPNRELELLLSSHCCMHADPKVNEKKINNVFKTSRTEQAIRGGEGVNWSQLKNSAQHPLF